MIMAKDALLLSCSELNENDFTNEMYRLCFNTLKTMHDKGEIVDIISLNTRLLESEHYKENNITLLADIVSSVGTSIYIKT